jgi:hypothetical protein
MGEIVSIPFSCPGSEEMLRVLSEKIARLTIVLSNIHAFVSPSEKNNVFISRPFVTIHKFR